jgi:hypothetical protein
MGKLHLGKLYRERAMTEKMPTQINNAHTNKQSPLLLLYIRLQNLGLEGKIS